MTLNERITRTSASFPPGGGCTTSLRKHLFPAAILALILLQLFSGGVQSAPPSILDRFPNSNNNFQPPSSAGSLPSLPGGGGGGGGLSSLPSESVDDPCYDQDGSARRCTPDFVNAAFSRPILASSTCGEAGPTSFCPPPVVPGPQPMPVDAPGSSWKRSAPSARSSSSAAAACQLCDANNPRLNHPSSFLTDLNNPNNLTCWISEPVPGSGSGAASSASVNNVSLTLNLGKKFEVSNLLLFYFIISAHCSVFCVWVEMKICMRPINVVSL